MTLPIPSRFVKLGIIQSNLERMRYYEFLLQLTRNSRFKASEEMAEEGKLKPASYVAILIHLLVS